MVCLLRAQNGTFGRQNSGTQVVFMYMYFSIKHVFALIVFHYHHSSDFFTIHPFFFFNTNFNKLLIVALSMQINSSLHIRSNMLVLDMHGMCGVLFYTSHLAISHVFFYIPICCVASP
jgi:hypothetical protein